MVWDDCTFADDPDRGTWDGDPSFADAVVLVRKCLEQRRSLATWNALKATGMDGVIVADKNCIFCGPSRIAVFRLPCRPVPEV